LVAERLFARVVDVVFKFVGCLIKLNRFVITVFYRFFVEYRVKTTVIYAHLVASIPAAASSSHLNCELETAVATCKFIEAANTVFCSFSE
jgi:hypothetical protein